MHGQDGRVEVVGDTGQGVHDRGHLRGPVLVGAVQPVEGVHHDESRLQLLHERPQPVDAAPVIQSEPLTVQDVDRRVGDAERLGLSRHPIGDTGERTLFDGEQGRAPDLERPLARE